MGATVTTAKAVTAFQASDGAINYVLYEQTYEKNCHPATPSWGCVEVGTIKDALRRIFGMASCCEGGSLQGRGGKISPESYIAGWLEALRQPATMPDQPVVLKVGTGFADSIRADQAIKAAEIIASHGRGDIVEQLSSGSAVRVSLHQEARLIADLRRSAQLSAWRLIGGDEPPRSVPNPALAYVPQPSAPVALQAPTVYRLDAENRLLQGPDGGWYCAGWAYAVVGSYIDALWQQELAAPGSYRRCIRTYRAAVDAAKALPSGTRVVLSDFATLPVHERRRVERFIQENAVVQTDFGIELEVVPNQQAPLGVEYLPRQCTRWILPAECTTPTPSPAQLSLLAA